jgi:hypothetical protein
MVCVIICANISKYCDYLENLLKAQHLKFPRQHHFVLRKYIFGTIFDTYYSNENDLKKNIEAMKTIFKDNRL